MKSRIFTIVVLSCVWFVILPAQKPKDMKPGVERWPIKTGAPKIAQTPKVILFDDLVKLAKPPGVQKNDPRYQNAFIPAFKNSLNVREGDIVQVSGWLHLVAFEVDGDYHLQMSDSDSSGNYCLIVEVPYPDYIKKSGVLKKKCDTVRKFIKKNALGGKEPSTSGTILKQALHVTVTGQLFYDDSHVNDPPRGKKGMHAATLWELHPVTDIQSAPPPGH